MSRGVFGLAADNGAMTAPDQLPDAELLARAHRWRRQALYGTTDARGHANAHEAEVRRRFSGVTTVCGLFEPMRPAPRRPFWQFWS